VFIRLLVVVGALVIVLSGNASAQLLPATFRTPLFGVASEQMVRVSAVLVNPGAARARLTIRVRVRDLSGRVVAERSGGAVDATLGGFVDLGVAPSTTTLPGALLPARRAQVTTEALVTIDSADGGAFDDRVLQELQRSVRLTLEVFDTSTGRTTFTMPVVRVGFDPQPDPPAY
jgi:hypothetical protein